MDRDILTTTENTPESQRVQTRRVILRLLMAYAAVTALAAVIGIIEGLETESGLINVLSKVPNSFLPDSISDVLAFGAVFALLNYVGKREVRPDVWTCVLSLVLAVFYVLAVVCLNMHSLKFFTANAYQVAFSLLCILGYAVIFYPVLRLIERLFECSAPRGKEIAHPMRTAAVLIFSGMLPWILMNYPGSFCPDSAGQIMQYMGISPWNAHHPPLNTAIMGFWFYIGRFFIDANFGCFLYILFQTVCAALIFAYGVSELYRMGASRRAYIVMVIFFAATPIWGCFAQYYEKDLLYAEAFALTLIYILQIVRKRTCTGADAVRLILSGTAAALLRKSGLYELALPVLLLLPATGKAGRKWIVCAGVSILVLVCGANRVLYPALGIEPGSIKEALSIPFQQTAAYVNAFPDEVTEEEREIIDSVLDYDKLSDYRQEVSDRVKATYRGDASRLPAYFGVWFKMLLKHPGNYVESFFMQCFGYLAPVRSQLDGVIQQEYFPGFKDLGIYRVFGDSPAVYFNLLRLFFTDLPLTTVLCMAGTYTWAAMTCFVQLLRKKKFAELIVFLPVIMNILVCIASPLSSATRYELPVIAVTPLLISWTAVYSKETE